MSHAILDSDQPVKAMIVLAGNPVLSIGGEERLRKAFEQLDLLVCVDLYRNATGELADWVLPATDQFERDDLNIVNIGTSHRPFAQYTPAVVEPAGERRPEWWIVAALLQAMGRPSLLDDEQPDPWAKWRHMLARRGIDLDALADEVHVLVAAGARPVLRRPGADRRRPGGLLPGGVRPGDRALRGDLRRAGRRARSAG